MSPLRLPALGVLVSVLGASACQKARPPAASGGPGARVESIEMAFIAKHVALARRAGASEPVLVGGGAAAAGDTVGGRVTLPEGACALFLAGGSASVEDVDAFVYGADGSVLGADESQRPVGAVLVCPPHPAVAYAFARMAAGHGLVALSQQTVRPARVKAVSEAVGARASLNETPIAQSDWPGLDDVVATRHRALGGTWRTVRRVALPMDPRVPTRLSAVVEAGECLDAVIAPSDDVAFVELAVLDPDGRIIGRDGGEGRNPGATLCSTGHAELTFEVRPHAGRGLAAFALSATEDLPAVSAFAQVLRFDPGPSRSVEEARAALRTEQGQTTHDKIVTVATGTSVVGRRSSHDLDLAKGCTRLDLLAGAPARGFEAWLWSPSRSLLGHENGPASLTLFTCGAASKARLDIEGVSRAGPFVVESRLLPLASEILARYPLAASRLLHRLSALGLPPAPTDPGTPAVLSLTTEALETREEVVPLGRCVDFALALDAGAEGAELRVLDTSSGGELDLARGTVSTSSVVCALGRGSPLPVRLEIRVGAGSAHALLSRTLRDAPVGPGGNPLPTAPARHREGRAPAR